MKIHRPAVYRGRYYKKIAVTTRYGTSDSSTKSDKFTLTLPELKELENFFVSDKDEKRRLLEEIKKVLDLFREGIEKSVTVKLLYNENKIDLPKKKKISVLFTGLLSSSISLKDKYDALLSYLKTKPQAPYVQKRFDKFVAAWKEKIPLEMASREYKDLLAVTSAVLGAIAGDYTNDQLASKKNLVTFLLFVLTTYYDKLDDAMVKVMKADPHKRKSEKTGKLSFSKIGIDPEVLSRFELPEKEILREKRKSKGETTILQLATGKVKLTHSFTIGTPKWGILKDKISKNEKSIVRPGEIANGSEEHNVIVAVKKMKLYSEERKKLETKPALREIFFSHIINRLNSPNIVKLLGAGISMDNNKCYLVMELVGNKNLSELSFKLTEDSVSKEKRERIIIYICREITRGLGAIHGIGIIHRDLKPQNILIGFSGEVKLCDFGLVCFEENDNGVTQICGTHMYLSWEMAVARKNHTENKGKLPNQECFPHRLTRKSDIFCLGLIFWELFTGQKFCTSQDKMENIKKLATIEMEKEIKRAEPTVRSSPFFQLITRMLTEKQDERPSIKEISEFLETCLNTEMFETAQKELALMANSKISST